MSYLRSQARTPLKRHARCLRSLKRKVWCSWRLSITGRPRHTCLVDVFQAMVRRFHPATRRLKEIINSSELGTLTKIEVKLILPSGFIKDNDIRMVYDLGGGVMMDLGSEFDMHNLPANPHHVIPHRLHIVHVAVPVRCRSHKGHQCQVRRPSEDPSD